MRTILLVGGSASLPAALAADVQASACTLARALDVDEALRLCEETSPEVVVLAPPHEGDPFEAVDQLRRVARPGVTFIVARELPPALA